MKRIGIVGEGTRDFDMVSAVIEHITGEECYFVAIQPESDATSENGNGWKGVWKWCEAHKTSLRDYMYSVDPKLDLLVIHMDGDVARCEREVHCNCYRAVCKESPETHPLHCNQIVIDACPVKIPCERHGATPSTYAEYLTCFISNMFDDINELPVCITIPCDSTDAWIVAAYEDVDSLCGCAVETINNPWEYVICHSKEYHGVRIKNRPKKSKNVYAELIDRVCDNWEAVIDKCPQARAFSGAISAYLNCLPDGIRET